MALAVQGMDWSVATKQNAIFKDHAQDRLWGGMVEGDTEQGVHACRGSGGNTSTNATSFHVLDLFWAFVRGAPLWSDVMFFRICSVCGSTTWIACDLQTLLSAADFPHLMLAISCLNWAASQDTQGHLVGKDVEGSPRLFCLEHLITCRYSI